jgi:hypothetical protein
VIGALAFLLARSARNRIVTMAKRLRRPRYAIGFVVVVGYFGLMVWGQVMSRGSSAPSPFQGINAQALAPVVLAIFVIPSWFMGNAASALGYTMPEVSFLFPAPLSRRALIGYKLARAQSLMLFNAVLFTFVFRLGSSQLPRAAAFISMWVLFTTMMLHRIGAALVRSAALAHRGRAIKKTFLSQLLAVAVPAVIFTTIVFASNEGLSGSGGPAGIISRLIAAFDKPLPYAALTPFRLMVAPTFATNIADWATALVPAALVLVLHLAWVLRTNAAFEEAAAEASADLQRKIAAIRERGLSAASTIDEEPKSPRWTLGLGAAGSPVMAIVWKNLLCFVRTLRPLPILTMMLGPIILAIAIGVKRGDPGLSLVIICGLVILATLVVGGVGVRNDLRADLKQIGLLKTVPMSARDIVFAEVMSSALPLAAIQSVLGWAAVVGAQISQKPLPLDVALGVAVALPAALLALDLCSGTLRNGAAVLFPGWIRLGAQGSDGMEAMGQALLGMLGVMLSFLLLIAVPIIVAVGVARFTHQPAGAATVIAMVTASAILAAECYGLMFLIGGALAKVEPSEVT